jgi:hypothetical protein
MMLPGRKYDEWSQTEHKDRDYTSEAERKFFDAVENPPAATKGLKEMYRDYSRYLKKAG